MPARGPSWASRATASRTAAPPGSPSTTTTVYGPGNWALSPAASSSRAQEGRLVALRGGTGRSPAVSAPGPLSDASACRVALSADAVARAPPSGRVRAALVGRPGTAVSARWSSSRRSSSSVRAVACSRS